MPYDKEKAAAIIAVTRAAALCRQVRTDMVEPDTMEKGDRSPVTVADFGSQALVCQHIKNLFPDDPIVGEEDAAALRLPENGAILAKVTAYVRHTHPQATPAHVCHWIDAGNALVAERFWTLDPIDGTKGFLRNDQYAIALALIEGGEIKVGVLACPALPVDPNDPHSEIGALFVAVRDEGAATAPLSGGPATPLRVSGSTAQSGLRFVESVEAEHGNHALQKAVAQAVGINQPSLRMDSQAKYGTVARGQAALYLRLPSPKSPHYREKIWDHAAGAIIVQEAGGTVTDMYGHPLDFTSNFKMDHNQGVIVSAGRGHQAVIAALSETAPSEA